jgi:SAM-dependent methyltransferase
MHEEVFVSKGESLARMGFDQALIDRACPSCGDTAHLTAYAFPDHEVAACEGCSFVYLPVLVDPSVLRSGALAWENAHHIKLQRRLEKAPLRTRLDMATRFRTRFAQKSPRDYLDKAFAGRTERPRVLDIGCGAGGYLGALANEFTPFGIEISTELAKVAREWFARSGGDVLNMSSLEGLETFEEDSMDAVVLRSYLEHEGEPKALLGGCHRVLRSNGIVVVKVPNYASLNRRIMGVRWCGFRFPEHVNYFTPASLARMARETTFSIRQGFLDRLPTSDNMWAVLTKS